MKYYVGPEGRDRFLASPDGIPLIVDVLRASSTIIAALAFGAEKIIPVRDYDEALAIGRRIGAITIGEKGGVRIKGFDHGNSPMEMMRTPLEGKTIVMVTSNGTQIMAEGGIIASTLNAGSVAAEIAAIPHTYLLASGSPKKSDEDLCAATLIEQVAEKIATGSTVKDAVSSVTSSELGRKMLDGIRRSRSGEKLTIYGYGADVELICNAIDRFPVLPVYRDGEIRLKKK